MNEGKESRRRQYPLRITEDQHRQLEEIARRERRSINFVIGEAIDQYIERRSRRAATGRPT